MSSLPLEVHEVLEQEYVSIHGPIEVPPSDYTPDDIFDDSWARSILANCKIEVGADVASALNGLVALADKGGLDDLRQSPAITDCGLDLLNGYDDYTKGVTSVRRREINRRIVDDAFHGAVKQLRDTRLAAYYAKLHDLSNEDAQTALCISGGGIRTATFALGVMQGLASACILAKFHYLSTVSGGGYIGSWLSSWARRHPRGIAGVQDDLICADNAVAKPAVKNAGKDNSECKTGLPNAKVDPEPRPIRHLRDYSNYLSPKLGFLSADTWTMAALYVRNLLLNLLILIPILAAVLAIPRLFSLLLRADAGFTPTDVWFPPSSLLLVTAGALAVGFGYLGLSRPTVHGRHASAKVLRGNAGYLFFCIVPLTVAATTLSLYWVKIAESPFIDMWKRDWIYFVIAGLAMTLLPAVLYYYRFFRQSTAASRREPLDRQHGAFKKCGTEFAATIVGLASVGLLIYLLANKVFDHPLREVLDLTAIPPFIRGLLDATPISEIYVCFSVPLILLIFFVQNAVFVGFSGKVNEDYDREWWGRGGALVLMAAVFLAAGSFIAVFGPVLLYRAPVILGSVGGVSGILAGLLGFSAKTPANDKQKKEKGGGGAASGIAMAFAVPLFAVFFLASISLGTTVLIQLFRHQKVPVVTKWAEQFQSNVTLTQNFQPTPGGKIEAKYESEKTPYLSLATVNGVEHLKTVHATNHVDLFWIAIVGLAAVGLSTLIGVNRFSMHSLYRNRIIRAYLGASRYNRDADGFTGFDPHDNLQMYELRPELLWPSSLLDLKKFVDQLRANITKPDSVELAIWNALDKPTRKWFEDERPDDDALRNALTQNLNHILITEDLGGGVAGEPAVSRLCRNRTTLQEAFGSKLLRPPQHVPMHVVNTALNLTSGQKLAWQQRKAESFTVSPLHSGSFYLGYRDSKEYGGQDGISLGTAVTISGAAASPNQGYHSSPAMAFLLTVLNVRLGSWLGNTGTSGKESYSKGDPKSNLYPLALELTGSSNDQSSLIYLSDGGHFENLGLYEMVLRRCRYIVVSDGGCDPTFNFEDLGNAIRKIRTDLGVPIDIRHMYMFPRKAGEAFPEGRYVATARIRYSAIDEAPTEIVDGKECKKDIDGTLVYVKPALYSENYFPKDVYNYALSSPDFPHETTADQFFSESQFESYRALGRHVVNEICGNYDEKAENPEPPKAKCFNTVEEFAKAVNDKAKRDETFDIKIDKAAAATLSPTVTVQATPNARLVFRD